MSTDLTGSAGKFSLKSKQFFLLKKKRPRVFVFVIRKRLRFRNENEDPTLALLTENFPADKPSRLLESILATTHSRQIIYN